MDGIYAAYLSGRNGQSMVLLAIKGNKIVGADVGGLKYTGIINQISNGHLRCEIQYTIPPGVSLITGSGPVAKDVPVELVFELPSDFGGGPIVSIMTPFGPLNAKFKKLSNLDFD